MEYTIKDIAKEAGVSISTVSRVVNNKKYVSRPTREKVLKVINEYNYKPNDIARSMITSKTNTIGLVISDLTNPFYAETSKIIVDVAKELGYSTIICNTDNRQGFTHKDYIEFLKQKKVDGIIFGSVEKNESAVKMIDPEKIPFITYHRRIENENSNYVINDDFLGIYKAVKYLAKLNHNKIAFISGPRKYSTGDDRLNGFLQAVKDYDLNPNKNLIVEGDFSETKAWKVTKKILKMDNRPTAILAANDLMALAALDCCVKSDIKVPEDISLMGYDDIKFSSHGRIALSTVSVKPREMAEKTTKILIENLIENKVKSTIQRVIEPELVIRNSTIEVG